MPDKDARPSLAAIAGDRDDSAFVSKDKLPLAVHTFQDREAARSAKIKLKGTQGQEMIEEFGNVGATDAENVPRIELEFYVEGENGETVKIMRSVPVLKEQVVFLKRTIKWIRGSVRQEEIIEEPDVPGDSIQREVSDGNVSIQYIQKTNRLVRIYLDADDTEYEDRCMTEEVLLDGPPPKKKIITYITDLEGEEVEEEQMQSEDCLDEEIRRQRPRKVKPKPKMKVVRVTKNLTRETEDGKIEEYTEEVIEEVEVEEEEELKTSQEKRLSQPEEPKEEAPRAAASTEEMDEIHVEDSISEEGEEEVEEEEFVEAEKPTFDEDSGQSYIIDRSFYLTLLKRLHFENVRLLKKNKILHKKLHKYLVPPGAKPETPADEAKFKREYMKGLKELRILIAVSARKTIEFRTQYGTLKQQSKDLQTTLNEQIAVTEKKEKDLADTFAKLVKSFILQNENLYSMIDAKYVLDKKVNASRLKFLRIKTELEKLTEKLTTIEDENIFGIDATKYEKLAREFESLSDKIEEKKNNLLSLKKKMISNAQTLAHIRMKEKSCDSALIMARDNEKKVDETMATYRAQADKVRLQRDRLRSKIQRKSITLNLYPNLVRSYNSVDHHSKQLQAWIDKLMQDFDYKKKHLKSMVDKRSASKSPTKEEEPPCPYD